jgi:hypothetical protein
MDPTAHIQENSKALGAIHTICGVDFGVFVFMVESAERVPERRLARDTDFHRVIRRLAKPSMLARACVWALLLAACVAAPTPSIDSRAGDRLGGGREQALSPRHVDAGAAPLYVFTSHYLRAALAVLG